MTIDMHAALEEGLAPMPEDMVSLREEKLLLDKEIELLTARKEEIKAAFADRLKEEGLQGFILHGKVHARVSEVTTNRVDSKRLKEEMPHVWKQYLKATISRRITIN